MTFAKQVALAIERVYLTQVDENQEEYNRVKGALYRENEYPVHHYQ